VREKLEPCQAPRSLMCDCEECSDEAISVGGVMALPGFRRSLPASSFEPAGDGVGNDIDVPG